MAQGNQKLKAASNKKGSPHHKRHATKTAKKTKKGNAKVERNKDNLETTKAINRKNERVIAAKALNSGLSFSLTDIAQKGKNEAQRQTAGRDKKQNKPTKLSQRLQVRLNKLKK